MVETHFSQREDKWPCTVNAGHGRRFQAGNGADFPAAHDSELGIAASARRLRRSRGLCQGGRKLLPEAEAIYHCSYKAPQTDFRKVSPRG